MLIEPKINSFFASGIGGVIIENNYTTRGEVGHYSVQAGFDRVEPVAIDVRERDRRGGEEGVLKETFDHLYRTVVRINPKFF